MDRPVTLKDLAKELNVSITTVSKAINNHPDISEKRKREILSYAQEANYVPNAIAKNLRKQSSALVGIVLNDNANPNNARVIKGIELCLSENGYHAIIMNNGESVEKEMVLVKELLSLNVAGVLLCPASGNSKSSEFLKKAGIPCVLINRYISRDNDSYVIIDDESAAYSAVRYLTTYGNKKIFFLNYLSMVSTSKGRLEGYKKALADNNIKFNTEYVIDNCLNQAHGYETMNRILGKHSPPFSVFCYSDYIAIGALCALQERGFQSPGDTPVMGMDDLDILSFVKPRLSTIAIPKLRLGYRAAELLIELMNWKLDGNVLSDVFLENKRIVMDTEMIIRETC